jgi:hypothetical protein
LSPPVRTGVRYSRIEKDMVVPTVALASEGRPAAAATFRDPSMARHSKMPPDLPGALCTSMRRALVTTGSNRTTLNTSSTTP